MNLWPSFIIAQVDLSTTGGQLSALSEWISSLEGFVSALIGLIVIVSIVPRARGFDIGVAALLFVMSFPLHFSTLVKEQNTLVGPLQLLRTVSRPVSFLLLLILAMRALAIPIGDRLRPSSGTSIAFLFFQLYYAVNLLLFDSAGKGIPALVSITAMMIVFSTGFGKEMQDGYSARRSLETIAWLAVAFVVTNLIQLSLGFGSSFAGGRFIGTSGNAQAMGLACAVLLIGCAYLSADLANNRPLKWMALASAGVLAGFLIASGSRGNTLACVAGLIAVFRRRLGPLVGIGVILLIGAAIISAFIGDEATGAERLLSGENTRSAVWAAAFAVFKEYPFFGSLHALGVDQPSFGVESSLIRSLALMGIVGGALYVVSTLLMVRDVVRSIRLSRYRGDLRRLCDFHVGLTTMLLLLNIYEGVAFGVLTMPVMFMYLSMALGGFLREQGLGSTNEGDAESMG